MAEYKLFLFIDKKNLDENTYNKLSNIYQEAIIKFNDKQTTIYPDAGFDIYIPNEVAINTIHTTKVSHHIKLAMYRLDDNSWKPVSYAMYPRSSFSKYTLLMSNNVGVFDSGYRGDVIVALRNLVQEPHIINQFDRLMQICAPNFGTFIAQMVYSAEDLNLCGIPERGNGGFGSTGRGLV